MDWLLTMLALINISAMVTVFFPRAIPDSVTPWLVFSVVLLATELAWLWLPLQVLLTLVLIKTGALHSGLGELALFALLLSWPGLLQSIRLGLQSGATVERSLREKLGNDYRNSVAAQVAARLRDSVVFDDWRKPFAMARPDVEVIRDISYAPGGMRQRLDIYRPRAIPASGCPVLLQIHGGAWILGDKANQALPLMYMLASKGWICVAANYRLSPSAGFPAHLHDCKAALAWIRDHGSEYGMNTDFVAVTGGSAGGHLAALMGLTGNRADLQPDRPDADTSVQACVPFYGIYDFLHRFGQHDKREDFQHFIADRVIHASPADDPALWDLASPVMQVHADAPPFMVIHGDRDSLAPVADARLFCERLRGVSHNPVVFLELPSTEHAFDIMHSPRTEHTIDGVHRFLEWARARHLAAKA